MQKHYKHVVHFTCMPPKRNVTKLYGYFIVCSSQKHRQVKLYAYYKDYALHVTVSFFGNTAYNHIVVYYVLTHKCVKVISFRWTN